MLRCSEYTTYCILQLISVLVLLSMLIFAIVHALPRDAIGSRLATASPAWVRLPLPAA